MKILMLTASLDSGGAETHILELARALKRRSHEISVASSGGKIAEQLRDEGISHTNIPLHSKKPHRLVLSLVKLRALIRHNRFDVIHVHSRIAAFLCKLALGKRHTPCVVSTVHARFGSGALKRRLSFWGRASIAVSDDLRDFLSSVYRVPYERIAVIPNAINTERFSPQRKEAIRRRAPKILFASRLDTDCSLGASLLCRIAPLLAKKYPKIKIEIAGGGKAYKKLSAVASKVNAAIGYDCIKLLGHVSDMPSVLRQADVFVGVSRAALEAMSSALPVVLCGNEGFVGLLDSSNISLAKGTNFCCRKSELPTAPCLYESLCTVLDMDLSDRRALGEYMREYVCRNHGLDALGALTESFYRSALARTPDKQGDIVLCGYYGFDNLGDDALLACAIKKLKRKYPESSVTVIAHNPRRIEAKLGIRAIRRENIFAVLRLIQRADKLILGGGSILQNSSSMRSLRFYCALIRFAHRNGVEVELMANGLGPLKGKRAKKLAARALSLCASLSFRDGESAKLAKELGCDEKNITNEDDLSSLLEPSPEARILNIVAKMGGSEKPFALIGIRGRTPRQERKGIEREVLLQKKAGILPIFIPMHAKEDKKLSEKMAERSGGKVLTGITPSDLLGLVKRAEFAIGNRYHLLYLARREGVPILGFGEDPKILSLK